MTKSIPPELRDHILPFNWDVQRVWALPATPVERPLSDFQSLFGLPFWSSRPDAGMLFDVTPNDVLAHPDRFPHQQQRLEQADLGFPVDFIRHYQNLYILDGLHRLARLNQLGIDRVRVRFHAMAVKQDIAVSNSL